MGSFAICMIKYRVKTTGTDKRHVVSFSNVRFSKVPMDFMFHDHDTAERHWYGRTVPMTGRKSMHGARAVRTRGFS